MSFENKHATLIMFCGLPGSGKTTLAKQIEKERNVIRLCPDQWVAELGFDMFDEDARVKIEAKIWKLGKELLRVGQDVILENGFWSKNERAAMRKEINSLDIETEIYFLDVPFHELLNRLKIRNSSGDEYTVPLTEEHMRKYVKMFQAPDEAELALYTRAIVHKP